MKKTILVTALGMLAASMRAEETRADHTPAPVRPEKPVKAARPGSFAEQRMRDKQRKMERRSKRR